MCTRVMTTTDLSSSSTPFFLKASSSALKVWVIFGGSLSHVNWRFVDDCQLRWVEVNSNTSAVASMNLLALFQ